jgi:hypothetical protein
VGLVGDGGVGAVEVVEGGAAEAFGAVGEAGEEVSGEVLEGAAFLHVDHRFGGQPGDGGGPDVVDACGDIAERLAHVAPNSANIVGQAAS